MTQGRLLTDDEIGPPARLYALDTCVPIWLDRLNKESDGKCRYTPDEIKAVWQGLEQLARIGRLKIIGKVKDELEGKHKAARERLCAHRGHRAPNMSRSVRLLYKDITGQFPGWVRHDWIVDPADPWLVAYAELFGYTIVTEEKHAKDHARKWKRRRIYIPDVCDERQIPFISLRTMAVEEKWLPA